MNNYEQINNLISSFSGQKNIISFPVVYLKITEDLNTALLLNQLVFWSDKSKRTDGFFYKTYGEWHEEIHLSEYQVRRSVKKLKELNIVETKLKKANGSPTLHYRVLMNNLSDSILKNVQIGILRNSRNDTKETKDSLTDDYTDDYNNIMSSKPDLIPYQSIIEYLNKKTRKNYKVTDKWKSLIKARWNEGQREDDFKKVVDVKTKQWIENIEMNKYLRPQTLFGNKFDEYLNEYRSPVANNRLSEIEETQRRLKEVYGDDGN